MGIPHLTLVTGGCRSGKSRHAQALVEESRPTRVYVATATVLDSEMADRVARHRADRGAGWVTCEAPLDVAAALNQGQSAVLVDCLTLWLTNLMMADQTDAEIEAAGTSLVAALLAAPGPVVVVTNEVGLGIVPMNPMARRFRDLTGRLSQRVAAAADRVVWMVAGIPVCIKDSS